MSLLFVLVASVAVCSPKQSSDAARTETGAAARSPLVGTWILKLAETTDSAGNTVSSSRDVAGMIVYTVDGHVAVQNMLLPRPTVSAVPQGPDSVTLWSEEQVRSVVETYDAYYGTFDVDETRPIVRHHVTGELRPSLTGSIYERRFAFRDGQLLLSSPRPEEHWRYVWERAQ
ncbi:MAG: lipocalin-like domain-containing protein [Gemmatimonadaceae bacterium]